MWPDDLVKIQYYKKKKKRIKTQKVNDLTFHINHKIERNFEGSIISLAYFN